MERTNINRFRRAEVNGASANTLMKNWNQLPNPLKAAMVECAEGKRRRRGNKPTRTINVTEDLHFHSRKNGYIYFTARDTESGRMRYLPQSQVEDRITSQKVKNIWGRKRG